MHTHQLINFVIVIDIISFFRTAHFMVLLILSSECLVQCKSSGKRSSHRIDVAIYFVLDKEKLLLQDTLKSKDAISLNSKFKILQLQFYNLLASLVANFNV